MSLATRTQALQRAAADPARSAWVSANAGSGKTHVLTQRVVRLLLSGVAPARILCLTFTRAAAANMATRVFDLLRGWTRLGDGELAQALEGVTGAPPDSAAMRRARTLFAQAVETPGGLKIQTIHAFCEALLHRFPFEANAPANFRVIEAMEQDELLRAAARDAFAAARRDDALGAAVAALTLAYARKDLDKLLREIAARRDDYAALFDEFGSASKAVAALSEELGLVPGETVASLTSAMLDAAPRRQHWAAIADRLAQGKPTDGRKADKLRAAAAFDDEDERCEAYAAVFFTGKGEIPKSQVTKGLAQADPKLAAFMTQECARLGPLLERRRVARLAERSAAAMRLAGAMLSAYAQRKAWLGALDFADLVGRVATLLERSSGQWVMYKLDQGLDHILLDEAQDTSPTQWAILRKLADEFFAGAGRPGRGRSFFAVGDEKQSIYSFQGAAPHMFEEERRALARRFAQMDRAEDFADIRLTVSFRSAPAILEAVDAVFAEEENRRGLGADAAQQPHQSWRASLPGRIEIWPLIGAEKSEATEESWRRAPSDGPPSPVATLAERVAGRVTAALAPGSEERVHERDGRSRPARPGDVMILMRKRGPLFEAIIRALKTRNVPVAGADRIRLAAHLATRDLVAAGRALLSPADDLSLACALKSPLLGLTDDDLLALCPGRPGTLAQALDASPVPTHRAAAARLAAWRAAAATRTPFAFYADLIGPEGGRRAFLERLGPEAGEVIDEFLALALEHENSGPPALGLFLEAIESGDLDVKRENEAADLVRVMTVHAAKGLEAKIVILPDTTGRPYEPGLAAKLLALPRRDAGRTPFLIAPGKKGEDCVEAAQARQAGEAAAEEEHRRLLYVALTRAEETLVLAGCHGKNPPPAGAWALAATQALSRRLAFVETPAPWDARETIAVRSLGAPGPAAAPAATASETPARADWLGRPAAPESPPARTTPSASAPHRSGAEGARARRRGRALHALIETLAGLPAERRASVVAALPEADLRLGAQALALIGTPRLAPLFGPGGRGEVALAGTLEDGTAVSARIDRLVVTPQAAILAEFKSGGGEDAEAHRPQIETYKRLVAALWPDRQVEALLVFAASGRIVEA